MKIKSLIERNNGEFNQAVLDRLQQHGFVRYEDLPLQKRDAL